MLLWKKLAALIVVAELILFCAYKQVTRPSLPAREQAQTVLVETDRGYGSAVIIKRGNLVFAWTAYHVVDKFAKIQVHKIYRYHGHKAGELLCDAHVIATLPEVDAALILIDGDPKYF